MNEHSQRYLRNGIRKCLDLIRHELGHYEQTTHGIIGRYTLESVTNMLLITYSDPTAYNVSELSQRIDGWLASNDLV